MSIYTKSFGYAFSVAAVLSALLVVAKEKSEPLMALMKSLTGHHWITHGVATLAVFAAVGIILSFRHGETEEGERLGNIAAMVIVATVVAGAIIGGFYFFN
jgi:hypothetical protein